MDILGGLILALTGAVIVASFHDLIYRRAARRPASEERMGRLEQAMEGLAQAQAQTEGRMGRLAQAQVRTEERMEQVMERLGQQLKALEGVGAKARLSVTRKKEWETVIEYLERPSTLEIKPPDILLDILISKLSEEVYGELKPRLERLEKKVEEREDILSPLMEGYYIGVFPSTERVQRGDKAEYRLEIGFEEESD